MSVIPLPAGSRFQSTLPRGERHPTCPVCYRITVISIHAPAWGATSARRVTPKLAYDFNPRSRVGSDGPDPLDVYTRALFQSTLPRGERRVQARPDDRAVLISIHAPAWGATLRADRMPSPCDNFNPRSRVGSDSQPRWRLRLRPYFNPRSRVGSDDRLSFLRYDPGNFNPRSRVGSDAAAGVLGERPARISIHAPAWGATLMRGCYVSRPPYFNPRSRVGSDVRVR